MFHYFPYIEKELPVLLYNCDKISFQDEYLIDRVCLFSQNNDFELLEFIRNNANAKYFKYRIFFKHEYVINQIKHSISLCITCKVGKDHYALFVGTSIILDDDIDEEDLIDKLNLRFVKYERHHYLFNIDNTNNLIELIESFPILLSRYFRVPQKSALK